MGGSGYKFVLLGEQLSGKTQIVQRFAYDTFNERNEPTVGVDLVQKVVNFDNKIVKLNLWDAAGHEKYHSMVPKYLESSSVAIIVYDVTRKSSLNELQKWIDYTKGQGVHLVIVGNKIDLKREVTKEEGEKIAKEQNAEHFEVSAKEGTNVNDMFKKIISFLDKDIKESVDDERKQISLNNYVKEENGEVSLKKYKVIFIGEKEVGKTPLIQRLSTGTFDEKSEPTIGVDFTSKTVVEGNQRVRLQIWDTSGQERFQSLLPSYLRDSSVAVVVYDVTSKYMNRKSFSKVQNWIDYVRDVREEEAFIILVGNKIDVKEREVTKEEGEKIANENKVAYLEVSAKLGTNLKDMSNKIVSLIVKDGKLEETKEEGSSNTVKNVQEENEESLSTLKRYKTIFIGEKGVGKTPIIQRFSSGTFEEESRPTIAIDFLSKTVVADNQSIQLQLYDTSGDGKYKSLLPMYLKETSVAVVVYDVTNRRSFLEVNKWIDFLNETRTNEPVIIIVGNKIDVNAREVTKEEGEKIAKDNKAVYFEVSAKLGTNLNDMFNKIALLLNKNSNIAPITQDQKKEASQMRGGEFLINQHNKDESESNLPRYKCVFLGETEVGKTPLLHRFASGSFLIDTKATIGTEFKSKIIKIENQEIKLDLWDTAGQERYRSLINISIKNSSAAIIVYDVTSNFEGNILLIQSERTSFESVSKWIDLVRNERGNDALIVVFGNKIDLQKREVTKEEGEKLGKDNGVLYFEVSALMGTNLNETFNKIASILNKNLNVGHNNDVTVPNTPNGQKQALSKKKNWCC